MLAKLTIVRGQTTYEFEADNLDDLARAERWVYESPMRLALLDEAANLAAAQPGDTVRMRTR